MTGPLEGLEVLDAFSCKGGAGLGYRHAGASVTAVDIVDYSVTYAERGDPSWRFVQADAVEFILDRGAEFSLLHMSAPCQPWTRGNAPRRNEHGIDPAWSGKTYIDAAREAAIKVGVPYVIENVEGAARMLRNPVLLCGRMFGLEAVDTHPDARGMRLILDRHRLFEFGNMPRPDQPAHPKHRRTSGIGLAGLGLGLEVADAVRSGEGRYLTGQPHVAGVYGGARRDPWEAKYVRRGGYVPRDITVLQRLLGAPHIDTEHELFEAIPPAFTYWVAERVAEVLR